MRAIVPPMNMIRRGKGRIGECAAGDDDGAGKVCSGFRKPAPTADRAKGFHHIRCGFALRIPYGIFSRDDPDIFLTEPHIMRKYAAGCTLTTRARADVVVQWIAIDLQRKGAAGTLRMKNGHGGLIPCITHGCRSYGAGIDTVYQNLPRPSHATKHDRMELHRLRGDDASAFSRG